MSLADAAFLRRVKAILKAKSCWRPMKRPSISNFICPVGEIHCSSSVTCANILFSRRRARYQQQMAQQHKPVGAHLVVVLKSLQQLKWDGLQVGDQLLAETQRLRTSWWFPCTTESGINLTMSCTDLTVNCQA